MSKVSIIIPCYNCHKTIEKTVLTIVAQTYDNIEILLIDDGSTDETLKILKELQNKNKNITVFSNKNFGVSYTRNFGIKKANGEYIMFVDSDDLLDSNCISYCMEKIKYFDLLIFGIDFFYENNNKHVFKSINDFKIESYDELKTVSELLLKENYLSSSCNKIFRKKILVENSISFNENLCKFEDLLFCLTYIKYCNKINIISNPFYTYIQNTNISLSKKRIDKIEKNITFLLDNLPDFFINNGESVKEKNLLFYIISLYYSNEIKRKDIVQKLKIKNISMYNEKIVKEYEKILNNKHLSLKNRVLLFLIKYKFNFIIYTFYKYK
ncbi:MAG: glycosyltransferase family 2 protein [Bacilli bacterium]